MVYIDENGIEYYSLSIFRFGINRFNREEWALGLMLGKTIDNKYSFFLDKFRVPEDFPETERYEWENVDVKQIPNLSKEVNYSGFTYIAEDIDKLKEKFDI